MRITVKMVDTTGIECAGTADKAVYFITFTEQQFC